MLLLPPSFNVARLVRGLPVPRIRRAFVSLYHYPLERLAIGNFLKEIPYRGM